MGKRLVVFGQTKMAQLAHFYFSHDSDREVAAFCVDREYLGEPEFQGLPVVPFETVQDTHPPDEFEMFVAVGYKKLNNLRARKYDQAKEKGYTLASYFCTKATHWGDVVHGENCFILENQVFQPDVTLGNDVVLWSGSHFGHDVIIGDHCWIASQVVLSGGVHVGRRSFVGVNAAMRDNVRIGEECLIGAGVTLLNDALDREVYIAKTAELYPLDSTRFERMMDISSKRK